MDRQICGFGVGLVGWGLMFPDWVLGLWLRGFWSRDLGLMFVDFGLGTPIRNPNPQTLSPNPQI